MQRVINMARRVYPSRYPESIHRNARRFGQPGQCIGNCNPLVLVRASSPLDLCHFGARSDMFSTTNLPLFSMVAAGVLIYPMNAEKYIFGA